MWRVSIVSTGEFLLENKMAEIEAKPREEEAGPRRPECRAFSTSRRAAWRRRTVGSRWGVRILADGEDIDSAALVEASSEQARDNYGVASLNTACWNAARIGSPSSSESRRQAGARNLEWFAGSQTVNP